MPLAQLSASFQSLPPLPTGKLDSSGTDSWVAGLVYILGPCGSLQWTLLWVWEFLPLLQPPQVFSATGLEALFSCTGTLGCVVCLAPQLLKYGTTCSTSHPLAMHTLCPSFLSPHLLLVWMNISSLTPWLSDFHTVWFSGSSGCFLFLNFLLCFFWLCKEAKCIYLHLHLGQRSIDCIYWLQPSMEVGRKQSDVY